MTELERVPPVSPETEQAVLGAMLIDARAIGLAAELLAGADFCCSPHRILFEAMVRLHEASAGGPVDMVILGDHLQATGQLDEVGGRVYLAKLATETATAANVKHHARIVAEKARLRRIITLATELSGSAYAQDAAARELVETAIDRLADLQSDRLRGGLKPMDGILGEVLRLLEEAKLHPGVLAGIDTGLPTLNHLTGGWQDGNLIILASRPSVGKTSLALQWARRAAAGGKTVAVFSLEMSEQEIGQRLIAQHTGVDLHRLRSGALLDQEWVDVAHASSSLARLPIYIDDRPGLSPAQVRVACRNLQSRRQLGFIVVDYLQLMEGPARAQSREQEVSAVSRALKGIAKEFGVPVLALSQLNRDVETRTDRRPRLADLRESGSIEQDADVVVFLYRPEAYAIHTASIYGDERSTTNMIEVIMAKQRNGPTGTLWTVWNPAATTFAELDTRRDDDGAAFDHPNN